MGLGIEMVAQDVAEYMAVEPLTAEGDVALSEGGAQGSAADGIEGQAMGEQDGGVVGSVKREPLILTSIDEECSGLTNGGGFAPAIEMLPVVFADE